MYTFRAIESAFKDHLYIRTTFYLSLGLSLYKYFTVVIFVNILECLFFCPMSYFCFFMDITDNKPDPAHCDLCGLAEVPESLTESRDRAEKLCTDVLSRMKKLKKDGGKNTKFKYQILLA